MLLRPILEVFVIWHPRDKLGQAVLGALVHHFHSTTFSGLAGGAVEVYERSVGWHTPGGSPRPLSFMEPWPHELPEAQFTALIPVLGTGMARACAQDPQWRQYMQEVADAAERADVGVYPVRDPSSGISGSELANIAGRLQEIPANTTTSTPDLCREVCQAIAQGLRTVGELQRIKVFVSHTKHSSLREEGEGERLYESVRRAIAQTRLADFFDAHDLQAGEDWAKRLDEEAGECALLMVRTDQYAAREWTQREVLMAKERDVPMVGLYALRAGEQRGSFLMDHMPTVPCDPKEPMSGIQSALNRIVDEALKHALWRAQSVYLKEHGFDWLPVHSPEPVTMAPWLGKHRKERPHDDHVWVIHPDPPLGPREKDVIRGLCRLAGFEEKVDVFTPRTFAAAGGRLPE
jgi:hypothetical protein